MLRLRKQAIAFDNYCHVCVACRKYAITAEMFRASICVALGNVNSAQTIWKITGSRLDTS